MNKLPVVAIAVLLALFAGHIDASAQDENESDQFLRSELIVPDDLWDSVRANVGYANRPLGFMSDEMMHFRNSDHILRNIEMLFRDIRSVPQFTGSLSDGFLDNPGNFAETTFEAYRTLDAYAARVIEYEPLVGWGVDWIPEDATVDEALDVILKLENTEINSFDDVRNWDLIPEEYRTFIVRVIIGGIEAAPWIREAIDQDFLVNYFGTEDITRQMLFEFAREVWADDAVAPSQCEIFEAYDQFDMNLFATGSNEFMRHIYLAIEELGDFKPDVRSFGESYFPFIKFETPVGAVWIDGMEDDTVYDIEDDEIAFVFNFYGTDTYRLNVGAAPSRVEYPFGVVFDFEGDDIYDTGESSSTLASGVYSIGAIFDFEGNDKYTADESGIGAAWFGTGLVVDYKGDDEYYVRQYGEGFATMGVGMLIDLEGDDVYNTIENAQGFSYTGGFGALIDVSGNDIYYADPRGHISELYEGRTVNFVQGSSQGRRADFYDGHSMGGGIGCLVDGGGDDVYTASCYGQGNAYWLSLGFLEDRSGNDKYFNEQYSAGASPHFGIGSLVDLSGDDTYNIGGEYTPVRQIQGHARDGALAVFIDGAGNDLYLIPNISGGASDLNCITLFWDRSGNDAYTALRIPPREMANSFGDSTRYDPFNTFRDQMASIGIFLDTGGSDSYWEHVGAGDDELTPIPFSNNSEWIQRDEPPNYGYGLDVDIF